jgi:hypothetical protein
MVTPIYCPFYVEEIFPMEMGESLIGNTSCGEDENGSSIL